MFGSLDVVDSISFRDALKQRKFKKKHTHKGLNRESMVGAAVFELFDF